MKAITTFLVTFFVTLIANGKAFAEEVSIVWNKGEDGSLVFRLEAASALNEKQKMIINSGFLTFSKIELFSKVGPEAPKLLSSIGCTVKFDAWEEYYDLVVLTSPPTVSQVKKLEEFTGRCLSVELIDPQVIALLKKPSHKLLMTMNVEQISQKQSDEVRRWLINQQSGVMPGLFSLMLGDLKLSEGYQTEVNIN